MNKLKCDIHNAIIISLLILAIILVISDIEKLTIEIVLLKSFCMLYIYSVYNANKDKIRGD